MLGLSLNSLFSSRFTSELCRRILLLVNVTGVNDMRLQKVRIQKYRSIRDTETFDIEFGKTILVHIKTEAQ
jgi:hypothetical protein